MHRMLLHTEHPLPKPDISAQGLGQAMSHLHLLESQNTWLLPELLA